jgi:hypothetical protein
VVSVSKKVGEKRGKRREGTEEEGVGGGGGGSHQTQPEVNSVQVGEEVSKLLSVGGAKVPLESARGRGVSNNDAAGGGQEDKSKGKDTKSDNNKAVEKKGDVGKNNTSKDVNVEEKGKEPSTKTAARDIKDEKVIAAAGVKGHSKGAKTEPKPEESVGAPAGPPRGTTGGKDRDKGAKGGGTSFEPAIVDTQENTAESVPETTEDDTAMDEEDEVVVEKPCDVPSGVRKIIHRADGMGQSNLEAISMELEMKQRQALELEIYLKEAIDLATVEDLKFKALVTSQGTQYSLYCSSFSAPFPIGLYPTTTSTTLSHSSLYFVLFLQACFPNLMYPCLAAP